MVMIIICSIVVTILGILILKSAKTLKLLIKNENLENIVNKFPENIDICKTILKKLNNENVKIEQTNETKTSLYIAITNKIIIANIKDTFTRVQTIAHECLHSVQNRKMLLFNFIFSNIYILYFIFICILTIIGLIKNGMIYNQIFMLAGLIYYVVRSFLETDAMIKAKYVAKEYLYENNLCNKKETEELINEYDKLNVIGIPLYNYNLLFNVVLKILVYSIICYIFC